MPINYPWFDHPPLMGLLTGGWAYLKGARIFEDTTTSIIRKPSYIRVGNAPPIINNSF